MATSVMKKHSWVRGLIDGPTVGGLVGAIGARGRVVAEGAWGSCGHLLAGAVARRAARPVLLVVGHLDEADEAVADLELVGDVEAVGFPALELMPGEGGVSLELLADRLAVVSRLIEGDQPGVIVAPIQALMQPVPRAEAIGSMVLELRTGEQVEQERVIQWLADAGYSRVDAVEQAGDFAVRGGIVDIFPPGNLPPSRVDFFGDQIDEIAEIDVGSMGSDRKMRSLRLIGASAERVQDEDRTTSLWSMLGERTVVVLHEVLEIAEQGRGYYERLTEPMGIYAPRTVHKALGEFAVVEVNQFADPAPGSGAALGDGERRVQLPARSLMNFDSDAANAVRELGELATGGSGGEADAHRVVVLCQRGAERDRLRELLIEHAPDAAGRVEIELGYVYRGFAWGEGDAEPLVVVPHHEMFHRFRSRRRIRQVGAPGAPGTPGSGSGRAVETFLDIEPGDYVVHAHHGIAVFEALRTMRRDEADPGEEYLTLRFADRVLLHVPASQIELVHKYIGGFSGRPPLSKLGGTRWKKQKEQVGESVRELAAELLRVQAARAAMPGIRYGADTAWQKQFEAEFPYEETDDQLAGIVQIKRDMADAQPMDRLVCGDVGYGKTELAMRAAFKAIEAGKQVAVLCPTTVLCEQHERTFRERMADYPVRIASINRFKSAPVVRAALRGARDGTVDILIGTHRLLSPDVAFADLGLVVVDEEQRFGVEDKAKLMRFRVTVDVLTMSATPIPRTLHMALLGLRDISSLSTPPADRRAVVTEVVPYDGQRIRRAILRELNRGGQCFFVHNRVHNIRQVAAEVRALAPEARLAVGHGQMRGRELEEVMLRFVRGEIDVLVCTTIIESGIDIPSANTMFIADADRFGLAELHQLRGRVGRYKHRAYCYLLLPKSRPLSEVAQRRLRAIEEFSMLGAGFKIAMRDMEIRGVGNILGAQQSGHIATVGYEMFCRLLENATADLRREPVAQPAETHVELGVAGHLPRRYIPSDKHRMEAYRRIGLAPDLPALRQAERDLSDAYGEPPKAAQVLLALAEIRLALGRLGVEALKVDGPDLIFTTRAVRGLSPRLEGATGSVRLVDPPRDDRPGTVYYRPPANYLSDPYTLLAVLRKLLVEPLEPAEAVT